MAELEELVKVYSFKKVEEDFRETAKKQLTVGFITNHGPVTIKQTVRLSVCPLTSNAQGTNDHIAKV